MRKAKNLSLFILMGLFFSIPISTVASNIFLWLAVILGVTLISNDMYKVMAISFSSVTPLRMFSLFFIFLGLVSIFGFKGWPIFLNGLNKYLEILLMPLLAFLIADHVGKSKLILNAFGTSLFITLIISYARYFDANFLHHEMIVATLPKLGDRTNATVFKWHITHNFLMSFGVLYWVYISWKFFINKSLWFYFYLSMSLCAIFNIFFMVQGRTGYIVLLTGLSYFFVARFKYLGIIYALLSATLLVGLLILVSANFNDRIIEGFSEIYSWSPTEPSQNSIGSRLEFIFYGFQIFSDNVLIGVGVGNYGHYYAEYTQSLGMIQSVNPHNQYILFLVEAGLIGLAAFLYLNYICWNFSKHLSLFWMHATRIVLLSYGVTNLFNSFLFDFAESLFFSAFMALAFSELLHEKNEEIVQT